MVVRTSPERRVIKTSGVQMFFKGSFRLSLVACAVVAVSGASSGGSAAAPIGPRAVVKGDSGGPVSVGDG